MGHRIQSPLVGIGAALASLGAADANGRMHVARTKVDATVTGMVKAFIRIGSRHQCSVSGQMKRRAPSMMTSR